MSDLIQRLACALSESSNDVALKLCDYKSALAKHEDIEDKLTMALDERKEPGTTAIAIDDDDILLCLWIEFLRIFPHPSLQLALPGLPHA